MLDLFKVFSNESKTSKSVAKERLKLVLVHDRVDCSPKLLDLIKMCKIEKQNHTFFKTKKRTVLITAR